MRFVIQIMLSGLAMLFAAGVAAAPSVAERSPFSQGHWWDPSRAGSGFDMFSVGDQAMVIWYTYEPSGRPVWYTAQGAVDATGTAGAEPWPLLKHRWANGRKAEATVVGSLRLELKHPEGADLAWQLNGTIGRWTIRPFTNSGILNEIDHTGSWFVPSNSGWGFALTQQGDVLGGVLFTYDAAGEPTWVAGFGRDRDSAELHAFTGACPSCPYVESSGRSVGRVDFEFHHEAQMTLRSRLTASMAAGVNLDGARMAQLSRPASWRPADRQLARFDSDAALKAYLTAGMLNVPRAVRGDDFSAAPPSAPAFSTTNLQERDVDEADLVKTDGRLLYTFEHTGYGMPTPRIRVAVVEQDGSTIGMRGSVSLAGEWNSQYRNAGLYVHGDKLVSVAGTLPSSGGWTTSGSWTGGSFQVEVLNRAVPDELPVSIWRAEIEGHLVATRRTGDRLYVVSRYVPYLPGFRYGSSYAPDVARNLELLAGIRLEELVPRMRIDGAERMPAVATADVHVPPQGSRQPLADMVLVTAIDIASPRVVQTLGIVGTIDTVYASTANLYVASSRSEYRDPLGRPLTSEPPAVVTDVHQLRLGADGMRIVASGALEGFLGYDADKAAFRLSEHGGQLRALSSSDAWWSATKNKLTILEPSAVSPGLLRTVAVLPNERRPQSLGKPNELLYGTRFLGDRLYAVTFKKVDPLYVVDLSASGDPRIAGELELPGFSDYLHPLPNGLLLGFGKDAVPADSPGDAQFAWFQGLQLTLFDVSDATRPRELQRALMGKRGSDSALLRSHHAFSSLQAADGSLAIGVPARIHEGAPYFGGPSADYPWQYSGLLRFQLLGSTPADARLRELPALVTHRASSTYAGAPVDDASATTGRSVLFRNGTVYVGNGRFWHLPEAGTIVGPY